MRFVRIAIVPCILAATISQVAGTSFGPHKALEQGKSDPKKDDTKRGKSRASAERLARGRYLVEGVALCLTCHSEQDWNVPGAPPKPGKKGAGSLFPDKSIAFPLLAPNITPDPETGAGKWTDEQFASAIREGIGHDGRRLFPVMPYMNYRVLSDEDLAAIIAYLRSIPPVRNALSPTPLPEPVKATLPPPMPIMGPVPQPDFSNSVKRGEYLVALGECHTCHTPIDEQGQFLPGQDFSGGRTFEGPWGKVASANITPDASGISYYSAPLFREVLRTGHVRTRKLNSIMLWGFFKNMTNEDLNSIYAYLGTLRPISHRVDNTEPPTLCKKCGQRHGYGDRN